LKETCCQYENLHLSFFPVIPWDWGATDGARSGVKMSHTTLTLFQQFSSVFKVA
jgi:hypothetical protein